MIEVSLKFIIYVGGSTAILHLRGGRKLPYRLRWKSKKEREERLGRIHRAMQEGSAFARFTDAGRFMGVVATISN